MSTTIFVIVLAAALLALLFWIIRLRRLAQKSRSNESRLQALVNSTEGIFWEADATTFTFSYISDSAERLLGYTRDDWLQPGFWAAHLHPEDQSWAVEYCAACTARIEPHDFQYRFICKNGDVIWLRDLVTVVEKNGRPDKLLGVMIDISEQKANEERLKRERQATFAILEGSPVACALSDSRQTFTYVNPAFTRLLGYQVEDISPLEKWREAAYPDPEYRRWVGQSWQTEKIASAKQGIVFTPTELDIQTRDGRKVTVVASAAPYGEATDQVRLVIFHDVTERKVVENELVLKNTLLATQLEASIDAVMMVDDQRRVIAANQRYIELWGLQPEHVVPGADSTLQRRFKAKLVDMNAFSDRLEHLYTHTNETSFDEITFKDGRIIDRYSAPMIGPDGHYYGRLWSLRDITERKKSETLIWQQANYDALTNLPNRRMLIDRVDQEIKKACRNNSQLTVLCLDLDHFKEVNDTLGHAMGDVLLQEAAQRLSSCVRNSDIVARLGGDEFVLVMTEIDQPGDVERIANKILDVFKEPFTLGDETAYISTSIGITFFPQDADSVDTLLKNADQAMYAAKQSGRCGFHYFTESMQEQALIRMRTLNDLRAALPNNELALVYQPIVTLATGSIDKAEALLRWQHPSRGMVSPAEFIRIAEESGMIVDIGDWVFHQATRQVRQWRESIHRDFQISINTSPIQFIDDRRQFDHWFEHLDELALPGDAVNMEITEGLLMEARDSTTQQLLAFRDAGVQVSIDDFGTGYSSLAYLKKFDIDYLKIDQSFVSNLSADSDDMVLCEAIIVMAHKLNLKVIAEGIETEEQRDLLLAAGCDYGQGYLFAAPVSAQQMETLTQQPMLPAAVRM